MKNSPKLVLGAALIGLAGAPRRWRFVTTIAAAWGALSLFGCSDGGANGTRITAPDRAALSASLTGAAASALDANGNFVLAAPAGNSGHSELSSADANRLATIWVRLFAPDIRRSLEEQHGSSINLHGLKVCGRTLYARSSFEPPRFVIPTPWLRPYGPWWFVTLCDGGQPSVSVAVSSWATDLTISKGAIVFPKVAGNEFFPLGIPAGHIGEFPSSPEDAASLVARKTGRRISRVPELVMGTTTSGPPQAARWMIAVDSNAVINTARHGRVTTSQILVGSPYPAKLGPAQFVAAPSQPDFLDFSWAPLPNANESQAAYKARLGTTINLTRVKRRTDTPVTLDLETPIGGN